MLRTVIVILAGLGAFVFAPSATSAQQGNPTEAAQRAPLSERLAKIQHCKDGANAKKLKLDKRREFMRRCLKS